MPTPRRSLLNYLGIAILLAGMGAGEFIYWKGMQCDGGAADEDSLASAYESRMVDRTTQMYVGTFGLIISQWRQAAAQLSKPKPLAFTITVVSLLAAGGCFVAATRYPRS